MEERGLVTLLNPKPKPAISNPVGDPTETPTMEKRWRRAFLSFFSFSCRFDKVADISWYLQTNY